VRSKPFGACRCADSLPPTAKERFDAQQERGERVGPGNLWSSADGPHGRFDDEALADSPEEWFSRNRGRLGAGVLLGGAAALALRLRQRAG
jgi:hypothetical protein